MHNDTNDAAYGAPQIVDLGSFTKVTEDGNVPKTGSTADQFTSMGMGTGDLPTVP